MATSCGCGYVCSIQRYEIRPAMNAPKESLDLIRKLSPTLGVETHLEDSEIDESSDIDTELCYATALLLLEESHTRSEMRIECQ